MLMEATRYMDMVQTLVVNLWKPEKDHETQLRMVCMHLGLGDISPQ